LEGNTHNEKSLIETIDVKEAKQLLRGIECHQMPKHASWLNMVEIEFSVPTSCISLRWLTNGQ